MMKRVFLWLLVLNVVWPHFGYIRASDDPNAWEVFDSEKWGYSLLYPESWEVKKDIENSGSPEHVIKQRLIFKSQEGSSIFISVWQDSTNRSLNQWFQNYRHARPSWRKLNCIPKTINDRVADKPAISFIFPKTCQSPERYITFVKNMNVIYMIVYLNNDSGKSKDIYLSIKESFSLTPKENQT